MKHRYSATFQSANYCIFPAPLQFKIIVFIKHHMGKKTINVWCPASTALKNDSSIYFNTKNGFALGPGNHMNFVGFMAVISAYICLFIWVEMSGGKCQGRNAREDISGYLAFLPGTSVSLGCAFRTVYCVSG